MRQLVRQYKKVPAIRQLALSIVNGANQKDFIGEVVRLHKFVRDKIRYVKDIEGVETLQTPLKTLELRSADCDCKATLLATMLCGIGHKVRFVAVGFRPGVYSHVLVETKIGEKWIPLETTENWPPGKAPKGVKSVLRLKA